MGSYDITQGTVTNANNPNYNISFVGAKFAINHAENCPTYVGTFFANTGSGSMTASGIRLSVLVTTTGNQDPMTADIRFAVNGQSPTVSRTLISSNQAEYFATVNITLNNNVLSESHPVSWSFGPNSNYKYNSECLETEALLTISQRTSDFVTGGGFVRLEKTSGAYATSNGTKGNFGFNVKWNKSFTNLQGGGFNGTFRNGIYMYRVKATRINTLVVTPRSSTTPATSTFTSSQTTVTKINTLTGLAESTTYSGGNNNLTVTVTDNCEPGPGASKSSDQISIVLRDSRNAVILYVNSVDWSGKPTQQEINGGNIQINSSNQGPTPSCTPLQTGQITSKVFKSESMIMDNGLRMNVYPNPSVNTFTLTFDANQKEKIEVTVMDVQGRSLRVYKIAAVGSFQFGQDLKPGIYIVRLQQGSSQKMFKLVKQ